MKVSWKTEWPALLAVGTLALVVYSWVVWRSDPARHGTDGGVPGGR